MARLTLRRRTDNDLAHIDAIRLLDGERCKTHSQPSYRGRLNMEAASSERS
jgi:hypothetical protein